LNADKDNYLNYETSTSDNIIGNVCVRCHDIRLFGLPAQFHIADGGYSRVRYPEMIPPKENVNIKIIFDDEKHLLASVCG